MKKINKILLVIVSFWWFCPNVHAASASLTTSVSSVYVGNDFTITATVNSAAAWNIHVSASGPVSGCTINQADTTINAMNTTKSFNATCTATGTGTITITLSGDVTSADDGNYVNVSDTKTVTVNAKPTQPKNDDTRSNNNKLQSISVDNYNLVKVDAKNYTLTVPNDVDSIYVRATAEHAKAKVIGTGNHNLQIGENRIEVIITAENGAKNTITIKVTRKDGYSIEELSNALSQNSNSIDVMLKVDTKISESDLEKIKNSKKIVNLSFYDSAKLLLYSWIIDGNKISSSEGFDSGLSFSSKSKKEISKLSNYADGMFIELSQKDNLPSGARLKVYVTEKFDNTDLVNVYGYNANEQKLELLNSNVEVQNGYLTFDVGKSSNYLLTMSTIPNVQVTQGDNNQNEAVSTNNNVLSKKENNQTVLYIIIGCLSACIIILLIYILKKKKGPKKEEIVTSTTVEQTSNNNPSEQL